jgi:hypothetical protein
MGSFFLESFVQVGEGEHKLGPLAFSEEALSCGMTP